MDQRQKKSVLRSASVLLVLTGIVGLWACAAMQSGYPLPLRHPEMEGEDLHYCLGCHDSTEGPIPYDRFVHTVYFAEDHRLLATRYSNVCNMCHRASFCSDCHGVGIELKPSIKNQPESYRRMPHRGDYLTRHQIDGRINPAACYRCHGNPKTAATCRPCHG